MTSKHLLRLAAVAAWAGLPAAASGWQRQLPTYVADLALDGAGDAVLAGSRTADGGASAYFSLRKFSGVDGAQLWTHEFQGDVTTAGIGNGGLAVRTSSTGDVVAGGTVQDAGAGGDLAVVKLAGGTGTEIWRTVIDGAADDGFVLSLDVASAVAVDGADDVLVAGELADVVDSTAAQFVVMKLAGSSGTEMWRAVLDDGYASSVAVDANGDVVAAGVLGGGAGSDLAVVKFDGADGTELWRVVIDGSAHNIDQANALALDAAGNVVVAGAIDNAGTSGDLFVAKLAGTDGSEMWRREIDGTGITPPSDMDAARAVAIDASGDVLAGGFLGTASSYQDFAVLKLSGADGSDLWQYQLDGLATAFDGDSANALRLDAAGDVLAAGTVEGLGGINTFTIVKLDGSSGAPRWLQEIPSEQGNGSGRLVDVDDLGNVLAAGDVLGAGLLVKRSEALAGRKMVFADTGPYGSRLLKLSSSDRGILAPAAGSSGDPTTFDSVLEIRNPITAETASIPLPLGRWSATSAGYRYADDTGAGACSLVDIRAGRALKVKCKSSFIAFSLNEPSQGTLSATLTLGDSGPRYCLRFGGTIVRDTGDVMAGGSFVARNAPPSSCPTP